MSGTFGGFSDDDIKKLQNGLPVSKLTDNENKVKTGMKPIKKSARPTVRFDESKNTINTISDTLTIPKEPRLCVDPTVEVEVNIINQEQIENKENYKSNEIANEGNQCNDTNKDDANSTDKKPVYVEELQMRQKLMEEQNRRRKELLIKALADKRKRTQEEVQRLNEIQNEFKKLDAVLSNDVKLLRRRIESASVIYMEAEKRYLRTEKEFLDAKLDLQQKLEKKELLTEHLCTIIEQNEQRKAEKLTKLLNKLDLKDVDELENSRGA
ncbi:hypothetical protein AMK59_4216, partial [Oryctes borbonicus]